MWIVAAAGLARAAPPRSPADSAVSNRLSALEQGQRQLAGEVRALREDLSRLLERMPGPDARPPQVGDPLSLEALPTRGSADAPVAVIEYADFECPYCGAFSQRTLPAIDRDFVQTGRVEWAYASLPLQEIHPHALNAAEAAECAARQGRFWEMHDALFADQEHLDQASLVDHARRLGLNLAEFSACVQGEGADAVRKAAASVRAAGISVTPTFLIARRESDGTLRLTQTVVGAVDYQAFKQALDEALAPAGGGGAR